MANIKRNRIQCKKCEKILESAYTHDYKSCKCGVSVDGGLDYARYGWPNGVMEDWIKVLDTPN